MESYWKFYFKHFREIWRGDIELLALPSYVRVDLIVSSSDGIECWHLSGNVMAVRRRDKVSAK